MAKRLDLTLSFDARDSEDGSAFFDAHFNWHNLPYEEFVAMEMLMMDTSKGIYDNFSTWLQQKVAEKKAEGQA